MSNEVMVRLALTGFAISLLVRYWYAIRKAGRTVAASPVRERRTTLGARRLVSRMAASGRRRAAMNYAFRLRTFRPAGEYSEPTGRRLMATLTRRQGLAPLGPRRPTPSGSPRRTAPRLRPIL
ncbi:hypothetical protein [Catellatospora vulcania]|uniref:hypothetical protein n=1 Tax=Catellatospora vulcania TaxID=1460450 RepID=UPI0012D37721|nr:hypothetical protein [Catellatospora vulcania]